MFIIINAFYIFILNRNLSYNQMSGSIPSKLGNLSKLNDL